MMGSILGQTANRSAGFTLLEILVALAVLGTAMGALLQSAGSFTKNQAYLRDRTIAEWVARNHMIEQQLEVSWPAIGQTKGEIDYAERQWQWVMQVTKSPEEDLRKLEIEVFAIDAHDEQALASLTGFVERR